MNNESPKGGVATPESLPPITQMPQTTGTPTPAPYPTYQYPYPSAPNRYSPERSREPGSANVAAWILGGAAFVVLFGLIVALVVALTGGIIFSTIGQHEVSATTTKIFVVTGTPSLVVTDVAGNVTIQQGVGNQVTVQVTKHAWGISDAVAKDVLSNMNVDVSQSGTTITVSTQFGGSARRSVDLTITVPATANADVHLGAGNIDARQLTGAIRLDAGAGNITAEAVTFAGTSRLHTGAGNITVDGAVTSGAAVDILVGAGNATFTLPSNTPAHLTASTGVGNLTITGWQIPVIGIGVTGHTASGDLGSNPSGALTIQVGTGNLVLMSR